MNESIKQIADTIGIDDKVRVALSNGQVMIGDVTESQGNVLAIIVAPRVVWQIPYDSIVAICVEHHYQ